MTGILAENRQQCKRHAASALFGQFVSMRKPARRKVPKTPLQALFIERLRHELNVSGLSVNALGERSRSMGLGNVTRTVNDVLNGIADPRLKTVHTVALAIGIAPWELLKPGPTRKDTVVHIQEPASLLGSDGRHRISFPQKRGGKRG